MVRRLAALATALICGCASPTYEPNLQTNGPIVRLYFSPLPIIGFMAIHPWFIVCDNGKWDRWEYWHIRNENWGRRTHVYKNLFELDHNTGWGEAWLEREWTGEEAKRLLKVLKHSRTMYPDKRYWPWPGPNSNTFVSWVIEKAGLTHDFPWRALGSSFR